jgi:hypothetical protein
MLTMKLCKARNVLLCSFAIYFTSSHRISHNNIIRGKQKIKRLLTFQMNMYHEVMDALLFRSTVLDLYHSIVASAIWPTPCRGRTIPETLTVDNDTPSSSSNASLAKGLGVPDHWQQNYEYRIFVICFKALSRTCHKWNCKHVNFMAMKSWFELKHYYKREEACISYHSNPAPNNRGCDTNDKSWCICCLKESNARPENLKNMSTKNRLKHLESDAKQWVNKSSPS